MKFKNLCWVILFSLLNVCSQAHAGQKDFYAKTLVLPMASEPKTFNVLVAQESSSAQVGSYLFEGLTEFDPRQGKMIPKLARSWEVLSDGLVWTFHLRDHVRWSDGEPFNAQDVLFTFQKIIFNPDIPNGARDIFTIQGQPIRLKAPDDLTVQFKLPVPFAPFLAAMAQPVFPEHALEQFVQKKTFASVWGLDEKPEKIIGTGPFRVHKILPGERIELVRNDYYWRLDEAGKKLPKLDRVFLQIIPSGEGQLLRFLEGETDFYPLRGIDYPLLEPLKNQNHFKIYNTGSSLGSYFLAFNQQAKIFWKKQWFQSRDFRRAIAYALDRDSMIDTVFNGFAVKQCSPLSPSLPLFFDSTVACYSYDPRKAKTLLEKNVHFVSPGNSETLRDENGHEVKIVLSVNAEDPARLTIAQMIREDLRRIGIKVHLQLMEFNALVSKLTVTHDWEMVLMGLTGTVDPHFGANVWLSNGDLHFWNYGEKDNPTAEKITDDLFRQAAVTLNSAHRKELYGVWQSLVAEDVPLVYTVIPDVLYAIRDRFVALNPTVVGGPFYPIEEIEPRTGE